MVLKKKKFNKVILIPARSGSRRLKDKNILKVGKKELIYFTISQALKIKDIDHVIVSTDSQKYANISKKYGASVYYIRPKNISKDHSSDLDVFTYNENWMNTNLNYYTDIYIHLRPSFPIRNISHINKMIKIMEKKFAQVDSIRSVIESNLKLEKFYQINKNNFLKNQYSFKKISKSNDYVANQSDMLLNKWYKHNGNIDIFKAKLIKKKTISGKRILSYEQSIKYDYDINTKKDFIKAKKILLSKNF